MTETRPAEAQVAAAREVLSERIAASLLTADWATDPLPSCPHYAHVNPDWLRQIIAEARAVRAALADPADLITLAACDTCREQVPADELTDGRECGRSHCPGHRCLPCARDKAADR